MYIPILAREPLDCANGAAQYLFYGGIVTIALNVVGLLAGCARQAALKVGIFNFIFVQLNHPRMVVFHVEKIVACVCWDFCLEFWGLWLLSCLFG